MEMSKWKRLLQDIEMVIRDVIRFERLITILAVIIIIGFLAGVVLGLNAINS